MLVIVDNDGTIADAHHRDHLIPTVGATTDQWVEYNSASQHDSPRVPVIQLVQALHAAGHEVVILTGAGSSIRDIRASWLRTHVVPHARLIMRPMGDHRQAPEFKRDWFEHLKPDLVIDDDPRIIELAKEMGIEALHVPSTDPCVLASQMRNK